MCFSLVCTNPFISLYTYLCTVIGEKWFLIFQGCTYVSCFVVWLVYAISAHEMWYIIILLILSILCALACIFLVLPLPEKPFKIVYLVMTCVHYIFTWIWFLHRCGDDFRYVNKQKSWIIFTLSQFLMITAVYISEMIVIFQFSAKLAPE